MITDHPLQTTTAPPTPSRPAAAPLVAVVVATHAYCFPMERCLEGFAAQLASPADVILVDNGSKGKVSQWARDNAPDGTTLVRERNGFLWRLP